MLAILFQEKTKKMLVFPKNAETNASTIEKGLINTVLGAHVRFSFFSFGEEVEAYSTLGG